MPEDGCSIANLILNGRGLVPRPPFAILVQPYDQGAKPLMTIVYYPKIRPADYDALRGVHAAGNWICSGIGRFRTSHLRLYDLHMGRRKLQLRHWRCFN